MKHANNDPAGILDDLDEKDLEMLLYIACHDFQRIAKGQPVELQVYEVWSLTRHWIKVPDAPLKIQPLLRQLRKRFPGLATASNREARALGWSELQKALLNPAFRMDIERQVKVLQSGSASL
jgi:hypothetical protein